MLPDPRGQRPFDAENEALLFEAPERRGARALRRDRPRHRQQRGDGPADAVRGAAFDAVLRLRRQEEHAAPRAQQGLEPDRCEELLQLRQGRAPIGPGLGAQKDELRLRPAAFEQAEGAQQLLALPRLCRAAQDGQLARDAPAPERAPGAGVGEAVLPQRQHELHGPADLRRAHPEAQRRTAQHRPGRAATLREHTPGPGEGLVPGGGEAERKLRPRFFSAPEGELRPAAHQRVRQRAESAVPVCRKAQRQVGAQAEPELLQSVLGQAAQQQTALALLRLQAELPVGAVALPVPCPREHGGQRQRERQRPVPPGLQREQQALAELARGAPAFKVDGGGVRLIVEAAALLAEFPACRHGLGQRLAAERERGAALRLIDADLPERGGALAAVRQAQAVDAVGQKARARRPVGLSPGQRPGRARRLPGPFGNALRLAADQRAAVGQLLLQQQRACRNLRRGQEQPPQRAVFEGVDRRQDAHAHMVGHPARHRLPIGAQAAPGRIIERLHRSPAPPESEIPDPPEIAHRRRGLDRQREKARVRRDHQLVPHAAPQRQLRTAVGLVAVAQRGVERVEGALRDAPGLSQQMPPLLDVQAEARALVQQARAVQRQEQGGHQVLEHGPRPARQAPVAVLLQLRPAESSPVPQRSLSPRHGEVACEHGLARHQVVAAADALPPRGIEGNQKQLALFVVKR